MKLRTRIVIAAAIVVGSIVTLEIGKDLGVPGSEVIVSEANAVVGRPLTPMSVARRT